MHPFFRLDLAGLDKPLDYLLAESQRLHADDGFRHTFHRAGYLRDPYHAIRSIFGRHHKCSAQSKKSTYHSATYPPTPLIQKLVGQLKQVDFIFRRC